MLAQFLAQAVGLLAAAAAPAAMPPPPNTVSGVTIPGVRAGPADATVDMAGDADTAGRDFVAIWPGTAYHTGYGGEVRLNCKVDVHGLAERCAVASEAPTGKGFGKAALELRPILKLKPATGADGQPIDTVMSIAIHFVPPKKDVLGTAGINAGVHGLGDTMAMLATVTSVVGAKGQPLEMRPVTMVDDPIWAQAATFDDVVHAYPAKGGGAEGYVAAHCMVERSGSKAGELHSCQVIKEEPHDLGFGKAALSLMPKFRIDPAALARAPRGPALWVDVPVRLQPAGQLAERAVMAPIWIFGLDLKKVQRIFPPEAADQGLTSGRGVARCNVAADGTLSACAPEPGQPDGLGFSEAAVKLASSMRMNLWSADAAPVEGGVVHIPIRLNLKGAN